MDYLFYPKKQCAICYHKFQVKYCSTCRRVEYGLCDYCHRREQSHVRILKGVSNSGSTK